MSGNEVNLYEELNNHNLKVIIEDGCFTVISDEYEHTLVTIPLGEVDVYKFHVQLKKELKLVELGQEFDRTGLQSNLDNLLQII